MTSKNVNNELLSRRAFFGASALFGIAAAATATGCAPSTRGDAETGLAVTGEPEWAEEYDVVVLGAGGAGNAAAIEAGRAGASVILLEGQTMPGGDMAINSGMMGGHGDAIAQAQGVTLTDEEVMEWVESCADTTDIYSGDGEPDVMHIVHTQAGETIDWLIDMGVEFEPRVEVEPHYCPLPIFHYTGGGSNILRPMYAEVESLGIETRLKSRGTKLYKDGEGRVTGVQVNGDSSSPYNIRANKGVVIATGGYCSNAELFAKMVPSCAGAASFASPGAQGDGIVMANEIGAATRRLSEMPMFLAAVEMNTGNTVEWSCWEDGGIAVDSKAQRFVNESHNYVTGTVIREILSHFEEAGEESFWMVCNYGESVKDDLNLHPTDTVIIADSIEELASQAGLDAVALEQSIAEWNSYVDAGEDPDFGRDAMMIKIEGPQYFAANVQPRMIMTYGGIHIDGDAHALRWGTIGSDLGDEVIPGLYAAGEVTQWNARGGYAMSSALTMGRIAGKNAAAGA